VGHQLQSLVFIKHNLGLEVCGRFPVDRSSLVIKYEIFDQRRVLRLSVAETWLDESLRLFGNGNETLIDEVVARGG
jgi:hypothetical protein